MRDMISTETVDGFTVAFYAHPEMDSPRGNFCTDDGADDEEILGDIESGALLWFQVECVAEREGVELATDWLGGCCYEAHANFMEPGGYADDMRAAVLSEARAVIGRLCASVEA